MKIQKIIGSLLVALALISFTTVSASTATAPGQNKLKCFDGTTDGGFGGICTLASHSANNGSATLNNTDSNPAGDYSGVYLQNSAVVGQKLSDVSALGYTYSGTTTPMPGDLSLNFALSTGGYAYVDAYYCPGTNGVVDIINDPNCGIWYNNTEYANWAALAVAYPTATITDVPFIVAERTPAEPAASWTISNVMLGKVTK